MTQDELERKKNQELNKVYDEIIAKMANYRPSSEYDANRIKQDPTGYCNWLLDCIQEVKQMSSKKELKDSNQNEKSNFGMLIIASMLLEILSKTQQK